MSVLPPGAGNMLEDSVFTWRFSARSGDSWGGTLIADSMAFDPGDSVQTAFGTYLIQLEQAFAVDLDSFGLHEGQVLIEWYWHRDSERFLPTQNGSGSIAGTDGLGSEQDAAWTGTAWVPFGLGGALLPAQPAGPVPVGGHRVRRPHPRLLPRRRPGGHRRRARVDGRHRHPGPGGLSLPAPPPAG